MGIMVGTGYVAHICNVNVTQIHMAMTFEPTTHLLAFVLPMSFKKGDIIFTAPATGQDLRVPIKTNNLPRQVVSTAQLTKGVWRALFHWSDGQQQYQDEKEIIVD